MRVLVTELWRDGVERDRREMRMTDEAIVGHLHISTHGAERYAAILSAEHFTPDVKELLPRLWSSMVISVEGRNVRIRGFQRCSGRLCHQEWLCEVSAQQR